MSSCERCWRDSASVDEYRELIKERNCTPEEQAGHDAKWCPGCKRKTIHQYTGLCMVSMCSSMAVEKELRVSVEVKPGAEAGSVAVRVTVRDNDKLFCNEGRVGVERIPDEFAVREVVRESMRRLEEIIAGPLGIAESIEEKVKAAKTAAAINRREHEQQQR